MQRIWNARNATSLANIKHKQDTAANINATTRPLVVPSLSNIIPPNKFPNKQNKANIEPTVPTIAGVNPPAVLK